MKKIAVSIFLTALTLASASAAFATVQPRVQPVAVYNNDASISGAASHGIEYQGSWGGGNGYFVVTEDFHDGSSYSTNGSGTSFNFYHYYSSYATHFGTLTVDSGGYSSSLDSNEVID